MVLVKPAIFFIIIYMSTNTNRVKASETLHAYAKNRIEEMRLERKKFKRLYNTFAFALMSVNLLTVSLSIAGITLILRHHQEKVLYSFLTAAAALLVILLFTLQFTSIIYRTLMRHKYYLKATELIQNEYFLYQFKMNEYQKLSQKERDDLLIERIDTYKVKAISTKSNQKKVKLIFRALAGGEDA